MTPRARAILGTLACAAIALLLAGCFNPFRPRVTPVGGISTPPPVPSSPAGVLRLFEWCWNNRAIDQYREIFTEDYQFVFALGDTNGNTYRGRAQTREEELASAEHLFVGGSATQPPANRIQLDFDPNLIPLPDSRTGKNPRWHKEVLTTVALTIDTDGVDFDVIGKARFFVVRGDSAVIPQELAERGFLPDSNRWYIERWEDETLGQGGVAGAAARALRFAPATARPASPADAWPPLPEGPVSWGRVKAVYR